jgi:hypothetical protein
MSERERSKSFLEQFNFKLLDSHYFEELQSSFWDSENIMTKKYKAKRERIIKKEIMDGDIESLEKAYKILLTTKTRQQYCKFLMYQYTLSQPLNMDLLIEKYYSIIFPFYLFPLKSEKEENKYIILDNMNFSVNYYERNALKNSFEVDTIEDMKLNINENFIKIKIIKTKNDIIFNPQIEEHLQLLYALIIFMGIIKKKKDNWKKDQTKVNEINQNLVKETIKTIFDKNDNLNHKINEFKLLTLSNDSFVPKGIKYYSYVQDKSKNSSIPNKFLVIGPSYIYLFKDQEMKEILNIIPLIPGVTMFEFNEREKNIKIVIGLKEYNLFVENSENFTKIQKIVVNIAEGEEELFDDDDLIKVSESLYNDKIMGGELKDTPLFCKSGKDLSLLEIKIDQLSKAKMRAEEKSILFQAIKDLDNNSNNNEKQEKNEINNIINEKKDEIKENGENDKKVEEVEVNEIKKNDDKNEDIKEDNKIEEVKESNKLEEIKDNNKIEEIKDNNNDIRENEEIREININENNEKDKENNEILENNEIIDNNEKGKIILDTGNNNGLLNINNDE